MKGAFGGAKSRVASGSAKALIEGVSGAQWQNVLSSVLGSGSALMVGTTRDGSTVVLTLFQGEDRGKVYATTLAELKSAVADLLANTVSGTDPVPF
jgi:hypothetical protein